MKILFSTEFKKAFRRLPQDIRKKARRQLQLLEQNLRHPGIKARKMTNVEDVWEGRVDDKYRFTFRIEGDTFVMRRIGSHDIYKSP